MASSARSAFGATAGAVTRVLGARLHGPALPLIGALAVADLLANAWTLLHFSGAALPFGAVVLLVGVCALYSGPRPAPILAEATWYAALWIGFSLIGCCLTYEAAAFALPLHDQALARADAALGFDWVRWSALVAAHPVLKGVLALAYASLLPQILLAIGACAGCSSRRANEALIAAAAIALALTCLGSMLWPALGAWTEAGLRPPPRWAADLLAVRAGQRDFAIPDLQGIVSFPSYHAVLGILFCWSLWPLRRMRWPMLGLNTAMFLSIPSEGDHYLTDIIAGAAVAAVSILAADRLVRPTKP